MATVQLECYSVTYHPVTVPRVLRYFVPKYEWLVALTHASSIHGAIFRHTSRRCKAPPRFERREKFLLSKMLSSLKHLEDNSNQLRIARTSYFEATWSKLEAILQSSKISLTLLLTGGKTRRLVTGMRKSCTRESNPQQGKPVYCHTLSHSNQTKRWA